MMIASELTSKRFDVLDGGYIMLMDAMPLSEDIEQRCTEISRLSYKGRRKTEDVKLWRHLVAKGGAHLKALEFPTFEFEIRAPLQVWYHLDTYRVGRTFYSQSGRRVEFSPDETYFFEHPNMTDELDLVRRVLRAEAFALYQRMIEAGIPMQQARFELPGFALYYTRRCKWDAKSLLHLLSQRLHKSTQCETREYARCIYGNIYKPLLPITAQTVSHLV